ncbi:MAG: hypothetical protein LC112_15010 [Flavobacteriales bacterium]|nr:hypothetical protein [Flavobacteriales bacterium]
MKNILLLIFTLAFHSLFSQKILENYPTTQNAYKGGNIQLFKDMQDFFVKNDLRPCNENEMYWITLLIDETGKAYLVRNPRDEKAVEENKCSYELAKKVLGSLKNWQPATENGVKVRAYFDFPFYTKVFFENYKEGYDILKDFKTPEFPGGINQFRKEFTTKLMNNLDFRSYTPSGRFTVFFTVNTDGSLSNIDIEPKLENTENFFKDISTSILKVKTKWKPGEVSGNAVRYNFRLPLNFQ